MSNVKGKIGVWITIAKTASHQRKAIYNHLNNFFVNVGVTLTLGLKFSTLLKLIQLLAKSVHFL